MKSQVSSPRVATILNKKQIKTAEIYTTLCGMNLCITSKNILSSLTREEIETLHEKNLLGNLYNTEIINEKTARQVVARCYVTTTRSTATVRHDLDYSRKAVSISPSADFPAVSTEENVVSDDYYGGSRIDTTERFAYNSQKVFRVYSEYDDSVYVVR